MAGNKTAEHMLEDLQQLIWEEALESAKSYWFEEIACIICDDWHDTAWNFDRMEKTYKRLVTATEEEETQLKYILLYLFGWMLATGKFEAARFNWENGEKIPIMTKEDPCNIEPDYGGLYAGDLNISIANIDEGSSE